MDSSAWTFVFTLAAHLALIGIDVSQITIHRNGLKLTALDTLAATYATVLAFLDSQSTFVLVVAENHHRAVLGTLGTEFNDTSGTCLLTGTTSSTFRLVDLSNTSDRVNLNGTKETGMLTVTFTQTAIEALGLTHTSHVLDAARMCSIKLYAMGTGITGSCASYHSHLGSSGTYLESQDRKSVV